MDCKEKQGGLSGPKLHIISNVAFGINQCKGLAAGGIQIEMTIWGGDHSVSISFWASLCHKLVLLGILLPFSVCVCVWFFLRCQEK